MEGTPIEIFAELMAQLDEPFANPVEILRAAGLDGGDVQRMSAHWSMLLRSEGAGALAQRYGDAYEAAACRLAASRQGERATSDLRFLSVVAQPFREQAAAVPLQAPPAEAVPASIFPVVLSAEGPGGASLTVAPQTAAGVRPFQSRSDPRVPEGMRNFKDLRATELGSEAPQAPALPFDPRATPRIAATSDSFEQRPQYGAPIPEGMRGFSDVRETQLTANLPGRPALPFDASRPAMFVPVDAPITPGNPAELTLEQYASLCVELALSPATRPEILVRYWMNDEAYRRVEANWQRRMAADPMVWMAWDRACAAYRAWLAQRQEALR
jgi:hypothetical protein